jgi:hypothetical protein
MTNKNKSKTVLVSTVWNEMIYIFALLLKKYEMPLYKKKRKPNLKIYIQIPNVIYCEGMI